MIPALKILDGASPNTQKYKPLYLHRNLKYLNPCQNTRLDQENVNPQEEKKHFTTRSNLQTRAVEVSDLKFPSFTPNVSSQVTFSISKIELIQLALKASSETSFRNCECQITLYEMEKSQNGSVLNSRLLSKHVLKIAKHNVNPVEFAFIPSKSAHGNHNHFCYKLYVLIHNQNIISSQQSMGRNSQKRALSALSLGSHQCGNLESSSSSPCVGAMTSTTATSVSLNLPDLKSSAFDPSPNQMYVREPIFLFAEIDLYNSKNCELLPNGSYELALNPLSPFLMGSFIDQNQVESEYIIAFKYTVKEDDITALEWRHRQMSWQSSFPMLYYHVGWTNNDSYELHVVPNISCLWCKKTFSKREHLLLHLNLHHSYYDYTLKENGDKENLQVMLSTRSNPIIDGDFLEVRKNVFVPRNFYYCSWDEGKALAIVVDPEVKGSSSKQASSNVTGKKRKRISTVEDIERTNMSHKQIYEKYHKNKEYFHSKSFQTIRPDALHYDSEEDIEIDWLVCRSQMYIDEFSDLDQEEKDIMKLWNRHVMEIRPLGFCHLRETCITFAREYYQLLCKIPLRNTFINHLMFLTKSSLITNRCLMECINVIDSQKRS